VVAAGIVDDAATAGASPADAGEAPADPASAPEPAVEDLLAAGAVVEALAVLGIDAAPPEAAAAGAAYVGLRRATRHVLTASVGAGLLDAAGRHHEVEAALAEPPALRVLRPGRRRSAD
jgi:phosphosulfolactate phosphohydrolase-like enzyme